MSAIEVLLTEHQRALDQAWDALARYKFWMFGYHAARVVQLATLIHRVDPGCALGGNPFRSLVEYAREVRENGGRA